MLKAAYCRRDLLFNFTAITSRQSMTVKETYYIKIWEESNPEIYGVGECAIFRGLSSDDTPAYASRVADLCREIASVNLSDISESSLRFGFETAMADLSSGGNLNFLPGEWSEGKVGININGLVWMGDFHTMQQRIDEKVSAGFKCIKLKIGGLDFERELALLSYLRDTYNSAELEVRLDANGAFSPRQALAYIDRLAKFDIHSLEQPIKPLQWNIMREICRCSPIPIALDEELIGNLDYDKRCRLLDATRPSFIILKPSLCGGFATADGWIKDATDREIGWWATSALESDIGLNAIARWVASKNPSMPQGLGTGMLYTNNLPSPLHLVGPKLFYNPAAKWDLSSLQWITPL